MRRLLLVALALVPAAAGCGGDADGADGADGRKGAAADTTLVPGPAAGATTVIPVPVAPTTTTAPEVVTIAYRLERHTTDEATADFEPVAEATLADPRGWSRAGFAFARADDAPFRIVLAEGDEVDRLCRPYDTYGTYSCQIGPVVALNADRWRAATPKWTGDLADYRRMLVNHEVGHLLGMRHPKPQCPAPGEPAPVMNQQSTELDGCLPNPWPLDAEITDAARHVRPLAPAYGE